MPVWLVLVDEAISQGWLGPRVAASVRPRIGDVVVATAGTSVVVRSELEPRLTRFIGYHGSFTQDEQLIPLLVASNSPTPGQ